MAWIFLAWMLAGLLWLRFDSGWMLLAAILLGYLWLACCLGSFLADPEDR